jgi:hypothetical protein
MRPGPGGSPKPFFDRKLFIDAQAGVPSTEKCSLDSSFLICGSDSSTARNSPAMSTFSNRSRLCLIRAALDAEGVITDGLRLSARPTERSSIYVDAKGENNDRMLLLLNDRREALGYLDPVVIGKDFDGQNFLDRRAVKTRAAVDALKL